MSTTPLATLYGKVPYDVVQNMQRLKASVDALTEGIASIKQALAAQQQVAAAIRRDLSSVSEKVNTLARQIVDLQAAP